MRAVKQQLLMLMDVVHLPILVVWKKETVIQILTVRAALSVERTIAGTTGHMRMLWQIVVYQVFIK